MIKKICIIISLLFLHLSTSIMLISAQTEYTEGELVYTLDDECITITGYFGNDDTVIIPSQIAGYPVTVIAKGAFRQTSVKKLYLPDTIMTIEQGAISSDIQIYYKNQRSEEQPAEEIIVSEEEASEEIKSDKATQNTHQENPQDDSDELIQSSSGDIGFYESEESIETLEESEKSSASEKETIHDSKVSDNNPGKDHKPYFLYGIVVVVMAVIVILLIRNRKGREEI